MTVSYQYEIASTTSGGFTRLLFLWKGSLWKIIWRELILFVLAFGLVSTLYRRFFSEDQKSGDKLERHKHERPATTTMTVSYQYEVASSTSGGFTRLLFMWRGSLWKLLYRELLLFLVAFGLLSAMYRHTFTTEQKRLFEKVVVYCDTFINQMPLPFVLGFYVAYVANRWWQQFMAIPWPDKTMHSLALYVGGNDEQSRILRRCLMRYLNLSLVLVLRSISSAVKRRFPTMDHIVEAGFMTPVELEMFSAVPSLEFNTYWIPCTWFISLLKDAKKNKAITDSQGLKIIMEEFNDFRSKCGLLWSYDWISIPLVYTQVVTLATYSFFLGALIGRQYTEANDIARKQPQMEIDIYVPVFTIMQFFFFMGLLKVAEQLINPFGDDDEDFELNWLIDRHTKVSYLGVDTLMVKTPPMTKDKYFDEVNLTLPYTGAAVAYKKKTYRGSVHNMSVPEDQQSMFLPEIMEEEEETSSQRNTPKNSFPNLFTAQISPSAGIWRQSVAGSDGIRTPNIEEGLPPGSGSLENKLNSIFTFPKKPPTQSTSSSSPPVHPQVTHITSITEMQQWSSNSTIDSYCSTNGIMDTSLDNNPSQASPTPTRQSRIDEKTISTTKKVSSMMTRRPSGASVQWKGVRWKPVIDDPWSDPPTLKRLSSSNSAICSSCSLSNKRNLKPTNDDSEEESPPLLPSRRNTSPTSLLGKKSNVKSTSSLPNLIGEAEGKT